MCWNWQVSLITWIVASTAAIALMVRRRPYDLTFGLLLMFYASMQFWEFLMWRDQNCGALNHFATYAAFFALWSHVFALGLGLYLEPTGNGPLLPLGIGIGFLVVGVISAVALSPFRCSRPVGGSCMHLNWGFDRQWFYIIVFATLILLCLVYVRPVQKSAIVVGMLLLSCVLSYAFVDWKGSASFWCFIAAAAGPLFLALN